MLICPSRVILMNLQVELERQKSCLLSIKAEEERQKTALEQQKAEEERQKTIRLQAFIGLAEPPKAKKQKLLYPSVGNKSVSSVAKYTLSNCTSGRIYEHWFALKLYDMYLSIKDQVKEGNGDITVVIDEHHV